MIYSRLEVHPVSEQSKVFSAMPASTDAQIQKQVQLERDSQPDAREEAHRQAENVKASEREQHVDQSAKLPMFHDLLHFPSHPHLRHMPAS